MNKAELVAAIAAHTGQTQTVVNRVLSDAIRVIVATVAGGDRVTLLGLGAFTPVERKERKGRNPRTDETITIPAATVPKFTAGKEFKERVNNAKPTNRKGRRSKR